MTQVANINDFELLELAAMAADAPVKWEPSHECFWIKFGYGIEVKPWNPLTDDGDALRLAVKLGIGAKYERNAPPEMKLSRECAVAITDSGKWYSEAGPDQYAATRRAIVRAAAEIGRQMEGGAK